MNKKSLIEMYYRKKFLYILILTLKIIISIIFKVIIIINVGKIIM